MNKSLLIIKNMLLGQKILPMLLFLFLVFSISPLYTQDGPNHKKVSLILSRLGSSPAESLVYKSNLSWNHTNSIFEAGYVVAKNTLHLNLSLDFYEKLFLITSLILLTVSYSLFLRVWAPSQLSFTFLSLIFWFHPLVLRGFYNFLASIPLTLLGLTFYKLSETKNKNIYFLPYCLLLWLSYLAHPFASLAFSIVISIDFFFGARRFIYLIPPAAIFIFNTFSILEPSRVGNVATQVIMPSSLMQLGLIFQRNTTLFSVFTFLPSAIISISLIYLIYTAVKNLSFTKNALWIVFLLLAMVFPTDLQGGSYLNERFLPFFVLFLPIGISISDSKLQFLRRLTFLALVLLGVEYSYQMKQLHQVSKSFRTVLESLPTESSLYPVQFHFDPVYYNTSLTHHFWALYDDQKAIFSPYLFAFRELFPLQLKMKIGPEYLPATTDAFPSDVVKREYCEPRDASETIDCKQMIQNGYNRILTHASYYDYVLVSNAPDRFTEQLIKTSTLIKIAQSANVSLWKNKIEKPEAK